MDSFTSSAELKTTWTCSSPSSSRAPASASSTPAATSTVLASGALVMFSPRLDSPLVRAMPERLDSATRTSAISPRVTGSGGACVYWEAPAAPAPGGAAAGGAPPGAPPGAAPAAEAALIGRFRRASTSPTSPVTRTGVESPSISTEPTGALALAPCMAEATAAAGRPFSSRAAGSSSTSMRSPEPPTTSTRPMPSTSSRRGTTSSWVYAVRAARSPSGAARETFMIGNSEADWRRTLGSTAWSGRLTFSMAAWSSASASSVSASRLNSAMTMLNPWAEFAWMPSRFSTPVMTLSRGCVTCSSTVSGPAPGTGVEMVMTGNSMSGRSSWLRRVVAKTPLAMSSRVARKTTDLFLKHQLTMRSMLFLSVRPFEALHQQLEALQEGSCFVVRHTPERLPEFPAAPLHHPARDVLHPRHVIHLDHAAVGRVRPTLDHAVLRQPVHELRRGRRRNPHRLRETPDRVRAPAQCYENLHVTRGERRIHGDSPTSQLPCLRRIRPPEPTRQNRQEHQNLVDQPFPIQATSPIYVSYLFKLLKCNLKKQGCQRLIWEVVGF